MTTQVDRFAHDRMPAAVDMPKLIYELPELQFPHQLNAVVELLDRHVSAGHGDRILLRDARVALTYAQVLDRVNQTARVLIEDYGLVTGSRVLLRGGNGINMAIGWLATVKAGLIAVATMPLLRAKELTAVVQKGEIAFAVCADALLDDLAAAQRICPVLRTIVGFDELTARSAAKSTDCPAAKTDGDDVALMAFTSGTTGTPKAALHTHRDLLAACQAWPRHVLRATSDDIVVGSPPLAFTFGLGGLLVFPMWAGASVYFADGAYSPESLVETIRRVGATICYTAPTFYRRMATFAEKTTLPTLRICVSAGEALPDATRQLWKQATGIEMLDGIGATEMFHIFISSRPEAVRRGAIGTVVPGYRAQVVDDAGHPLPPGSVGRLAVIGPTGCRYLDEPRQKKYVVDGWNYPGDSFTMDADGYFFYQARDDDMIITAGYNVAGPEVENCLALHEAVAECAVIGKPDDDRGMLVKAFVVLKDATAASEAMRVVLQDFVRANLAPYKYPRQVEFVASLPRTETGKLQRHRLREMERGTSIAPAGGDVKSVSKENHP
ncbi:MAG: AMP-binding protein [Burkholderiales bacterium]|nr:AMP-binding protein [Burkholderiales bacterium]